MNKLLKILIFIAGMAISGASKGSSQWETIGGPRGGSVSALTICGNRIFAATDNGVFLSTDTGSTWVTVNSGMPDDKRIEVLGSNADHLFAGTLQNGLLWSFLGDTINWERDATGLSNEAILSLALNDSIIFIGTYEGKIAFSANDGKSWMLADSIGTTAVRSLCMKDTCLYALNDDSLFTSTNYGMSWKGICAGGKFGLTMGENAMFAADNTGYTYRSIDNGVTWTRLSAGLNKTRIVNFVTDGTTVFAASCAHFPGEHSGIYRTVDNGDTWAVLDSATMKWGVTSLGLMGDNIIVGTEHHGIYRIKKSGGGITEAVAGPFCAVSHLQIIKGSFFAGTDHGLFNSDDGGTTWTHSDSGLEDLKIMALTHADSTLYAGTYSRGIYQSIDNGRSWSQTNSFDSILCIAVTDSFIFAGNTRGIQQCPVGTSSWKWLNGNFPVYGILSIAAHDSTVIAGGYYSGAFRSINSGKTWTTIDTTIHTRLVTSIVMFGDTVFMSMLLDGVYRSTDNGNSWATVLPKNTVYCSEIIAIDTTMVLSTSNGIYFSTDRGENWNEASSGPGDREIVSLTEGDGFLYVGTRCQGIWRLSVADLAAVAINHTVHAAPVSCKNFSVSLNRTEQSAAIEFWLSTSRQVTLKVYDMCGREVVLLANTGLCAGTHKVQWCTRRLTAGHYMVVLRTGKTVHAARQMVLR